MIMASKSKKSKVFSALEVANICGVVNQTAINWIKAGHLKAYTTPGGQFRVTPEDLADFMEKRGSEIPGVLQNALDDRKVVQSKSLIIVDDDKGLNTVIKLYIEKNFPGIKIYQAYDGFEAGTVMAQKKPGFVILDLDLPGVDGFSLCKKLKTDPMFANPYVVVVTALKEPDIAERVNALECNYFLTKPLSMEKIGAMVNQWFNMKPAE